jgi:hypothetical protein
MSGSEPNLQEDAEAIAKLMSNCSARVRKWPPVWRIDERGGRVILCPWYRPPLPWFGKKVRLTLWR